MQGYDPSRFQRQVDNALQAVRKILENTRSPTYPQDVPHQVDLRLKRPFRFTYVFSFFSMTTNILLRKLLQTVQWQLI